MTESDNHTTPLIKTDTKTKNIIATINDVLATIDTLQFELAHKDSYPLLSKTKLDYFKNIKFYGLNNLDTDIPSDIITIILTFADDLVVHWVFDEMVTLINELNKLSENEQMKLIGGTLMYYQCAKRRKGDLYGCYHSIYWHKTKDMRKGYISKRLKRQHQLKFNDYKNNYNPKTMKMAMMIAAKFAEEQWKQYRDRGGSLVGPLEDETDSEDEWDSEFDN